MKVESGKLKQEGYGSKEGLSYFNFHLSLFKYVVHGEEAFAALEPFRADHCTLRETAAVESLVRDDDAVVAAGPGDTVLARDLADALALDGNSPRFGLQRARAGGVGSKGVPYYPRFRKVSTTSPSRQPNLLITDWFSMTCSSIRYIQSSKFTW